MTILTATDVRPLAKCIKPVSAKTISAKPPNNTFPSSKIAFTLPETAFWACVKALDKLPSFDKALNNSSLI